MTSTVPVPLEGDRGLSNRDLAPTPAAHRTWSTYHIAALWVGMCVCIPTYMLAGGLIAGGMSWRQALFTIALGNSIVLVPMVLNAHPGTKYGIPFPVLARASFGVLGANVPALLRALVACGWFGIQTWIGGQAISSMIAVLVPSWATHAWGTPVGFGLFWLLNVLFIVKGTESIRWLEAVSAPFLLIVGIGLLAWAHDAGGGWGPILAEPSRFQNRTEFSRFFAPTLTGMVGFWATLSLNISDFSRYAKNQRAQILGQVIGLPPTMAIYAFIGVAVTSATALVYGEAIWDPVVLLGKLKNPLAILLALVSLVVATLTTNLAANVVSPANDFSNLWPQRISFRTGGLMTAGLGIVMMPWKLLEDYGTYIFGWLVGYSSLLGPVAGVLIADYYVVRRRRLIVADLYRRGGAYEGRRGFNPVAFVAFGLGVVVALIGLVSSDLRILYDYAWFVGFGLAFTVHALFSPRPRAG